MYVGEKNSEFEIIKEFKGLEYIRYMVRTGIGELGKITLVTLRYIWDKKRLRRCNIQ